MKGRARKTAQREIADALVEAAPAIAATLLAEAGQGKRARDIGVPVARSLPTRILEIPNNPNLREDDVRYIARCIKEAAAVTP